MKKIRKCLTYINSIIYIDYRYLPILDLIFQIGNLLDIEGCIRCEHLLKEVRQLIFLIPYRDSVLPKSDLKDSLLKDLDNH